MKAFKNFYHYLDQDCVVSKKFWNSFYNSVEMANMPPTIIVLLSLELNKCNVSFNMANITRLMNRKSLGKGFAS